MKAWGKAFKGLGSDMSDAFFDTMFTEHKLMPSIGKGISKAWKNSDWRGKTMMAGAGALMVPPAIKTAEGIGEGMRENPIATSLLVGGGAAALRFGASSAAKSFTRSAVKRRGTKYGLDTMNKTTGSKFKSMTEYEDSLYDSIKKGGASDEIAKEAYGIGRKADNAAYFMPGRKQAIKEFGGRKAYREAVTGGPDGGSIMKAGAAAIGAGMMYGVAGRAWN